MSVHYVIGYWIVDWKGIANYEIIYNIAINSRCWIWFDRLEKSDQYSAKQQGYAVEKIILRGKSKEELWDLVVELRQFIEVTDWYIPTEAQTNFLEDPLMLKFGRIFPGTVNALKQRHFDRIQALRNKAQNNEDLQNKNKT